MSLDIGLKFTRCEHCGQAEPVFDTNITHNVASMWRKAGCYEALYESEGKSAAEILPALEAACERMETDIEEYRKLNAPNGWGDADTALEWIERLTEACEKWPKARIWVSA